MNIQEELWQDKAKLHLTHNLIHCITNPISMNDCANAVLVLGGKPIMAQHPDEVAQITKTAKALALNLGNFDDIRNEAMIVSIKTANENHIPVVLDLVGVGCSDLRYKYAKSMMDAYHIDVIKGNLSEIRAMAGKPAHALGIDVGDSDIERVEDSAIWIQEFAKQIGCCILCSGAVDIISDGIHTYKVENGCELLTLCTGTGCMLNVITATFLSCMEPIKACMLACSFFGVVAEKCLKVTTMPGSFHYKLFDWLYALEKEEYLKYAKISEVVL